jgi:hypothetical protein
MMFDWGAFNVNKLHKHQVERDEVEEAFEDPNLLEHDAKNAAGETLCHHRDNGSWTHPVCSLHSARRGNSAGDGL